MIIPHSPLSFIYHVTMVEAYREELHTDVREALKRFAIEARIALCFAQADRAPRLKKFTEASASIERAAYELRSSKGPLEVPMSQAASAIFLETKPHLEFEANHPQHRPQPAVSPPPGHDPTQARLLESAYYLFYSPTFRGNNPTCKSSNVAVAPDPQAFQAAWANLRLALMAGSGATLTDVGTLADALAYEYGSATEPSWRACW